MRTAIIASVISLSIVSLAAADQASAAIKRVTNISPQDLGMALQQLMKERDLRLVYISEDVRGLRTRGAAGELTAAEALARILEGTNLTFSRLDDKTITILPVAPPRDVASPSVPARSEAAPDGRDNGPPVKQPSSFWDRFRLAQAADAVSSAAAAGSERDAPGSNNGGGQALEEIVVTAQKRAERLIDTPQSVTVVSADNLSRLAATQFRDFANTIPGLSYSSNGAGYNQISLRGITLGQDTSPTVGVYVDDVPFGSSTGFAQGAQLGPDLALFDVERIEVLRGPQGTLYGASTMGGLIKYVSRAPDTTKFGLNARVGLAATRDGSASYNAALALNAPLATDRAALRAMGFFSRDGGYVDNVYLGRSDTGRADISGGRLDLLLTPSEKLAIRLTGFAQKIERDGRPSVDYTFAGPPEGGELEQTRRVSEPFEQTFNLLSGTVSYEFDFATLTSISSYQKTETDLSGDLSRSFIPVLETFFSRTYAAVGITQGLETEKLTQEVRLASGERNEVEWLIGGFYTDEKSENTQVFDLTDPSGAPALNDLYDYSGPTSYDEIAGFGNVTVKLSSRFDVTAGLRFAHNRQAFTQFGSGALIGNTPTQRSEEDVFTYLANARWHFGQSATGYVRYATGYRPGGPNFVVLSPTTGQPLGRTTFDADHLKSYEVGFKADLLDRHLGLDVAAYHIDWDDIQLLTNSGGFSAYANGPSARVNGTEISLTARPVSELTVALALAWQDARLSENAPPDVGGRDGERLPNVPRMTGALNADYRVAGVALQPTFGTTVRYVSDREASFDAAVGFRQFQLPSYTSVDFRAGVSVGSVDLQLFVRNAFDERGLQSAVTNRGIADVNVLQPRTVGLMASTQF